MTDPSAPDVAHKDKKHRSPAYPFISLRKALDRAREFYAQEKRHAAPIRAAVRHWGFAEKSSGGQQTVAALKQYGLMVDDGSGADRRVKLADLAFKILLDEVPDSADRATAMREAALGPKLFAEMAERWGSDLPSDETIRTFLRRDKGYNDDVLNTIIRAFKETLSVANVGKSDKIEPEQSERPKVGEYVQWESQGAYQLQAPRQLVNVSEDGSYGFIEGETTGFPMEQLIKTDAPQPVRGYVVDVPGPAQAGSFKMPNPPAQAAIGVSREVFSLEGGEALLQWPAGIDKDNVLELEAWLNLVIRKLKRRSGFEPAK